MSLSVGTLLGRYEITGTAGTGGMGEVYRAFDTRLQRLVAIKVLPAELASDMGRRERLEREARVISGISHPHICALHDLGNDNGTDYLVMEYVEGETLAQRLTRGALSTQQTLKIGAQIADALDKAHRHGVIHRDVKPSNIMLTASGAKLLDFGLAKPSGVSPLDTIVSRTLPIRGTGIGTKPITSEGALVGTLQYMAPEQLEGKESDARTDVFALGAVLYEMATGRRAFSGASQASVVAAILEHEPEPISRIKPMSPPGLERAISRCLAKAPEERWQSAGDLAIELRWIAAAGSASDVGIAPVRRRPRRRMWLLTGTAILVGLAALFTTAAALWNRNKSPVRQQFAMPVPGEVSHMALSPDGRYLAFVSPDESGGTHMLFVQAIGTTEAKVLVGTEGASYPFWSPDASYVAFFAEGKLKKIPRTGGAPQSLATVSTARGGTWGRQNVILYTPDAGGGIWRVNADGGNAAPTGDHLEPGEASHRWAVFLPDGEHYLYWRGDFTEAPDAKAAIYINSIKKNAPKLVVRARSSIGYGNGMLFYADERGSLVSAPFDASKGVLTGEPRVLSTALGFSPSTYWAAFTVAENGTVVLDSSLGASSSVLTWYDRNGSELGRVGEVGVLANPSLSPDGKRVAVDASDVKARNVDVWIHTIEPTTSTRFTFDPSEETNGVWSRDGRVIAYRRGGPSPMLLLKNVNGLEPERTLRKGESRERPDDVLPNSWSADDSQILCTYQSSEEGGSKLAIISVRDGTVTPFFTTRASAMDGQISPNGRWAAYASNESGDWEVYVTKFPDATGRWQVSRGGGTEPRWSRDGKQLYYLDLKGMLTFVTVRDDDGFSAGVPQPLFGVRTRAPISSTDLFTYDVAPDGKRFLVNSYVKPYYVRPLTIILNASK